MKRERAAPEVEGLRGGKKMAGCEGERNGLGNIVQGYANRYNLELFRRGGGEGEGGLTYTNERKK